MALPSETRGPASEYVCVMLLVNYFIATHVKGENTTIISSQPETDIRMARIAGIRFARSQGIHYEAALKQLSQPMITVIKHGSDWFPAELHPHKVALLTKLGALNLGGSQERAIDFAKEIALHRESVCVPSIGIVMRLLG